MNNITTKLFNDYPEFVKEFNIWYQDRYKIGIDIKILITIDNIYSLSLLHKYLNKVYNIGIIYDCYTYYIYIIDPTLKVNELINNFNETGEFTHVIFKNTNKREANTDTVFERAIYKCVELINNKF